MLNRTAVYRFAIASVGVLLLLAACEEAPVPDHKHDADDLPAQRPDIVVQDFEIKLSEFRLDFGGFLGYWGTFRVVEGMTAEWFEHGAVSAYVSFPAGGTGERCGSPRRPCSRR